MAESSIVHGCLVEIEGTGVLIVGDPGVGKTSVCIELARLGHDFIADDAVEIRRSGRKIVGASPAATRSMLAVRGDGIRSMKCERYSTEIALIAELLHDEPAVPPLILGGLLLSIPRRTFRSTVVTETAGVIEAFARSSSEAAI